MKCRKGEVWVEKWDSCAKKEGAFYNRFHDLKKAEVRMMDLRKLKNMRGAYGVFHQSETVCEDSKSCRDIKRDLIEDKKLKYGDSYIIFLDNTEKQAFRQCVREKKLEMRKKGLILLPEKRFNEREFNKCVRITGRFDTKTFEKKIDDVMTPFNTGFGEGDEFDIDLDDLSREDAAKLYLDNLTKAIKKRNASVPIISMAKSELDRGRIGEGRHRIIAAMKAGLKEVPVLIDLSR